MSKVPEKPLASTCPACGMSFVCAAVAGLATCWCMEKADKAPLSFAPEVGGNCYCPSCLAQRFSASPGKPSPGA
ncbi:MAG: hypothetical protein CRU78_07345 [Candidatus Accumulibacter phosphatis]|uniref:Cysteine-rich CWC family protein n=1 Tax=Candidatus Accumulibacter phosphatis TaxID=327160 RepID=A0A6A7RTU2_9PROT|nr:hypothetical protein [Candidatus Accumulibacter phosphatis]